MLCDLADALRQAGLYRQAVCLAKTAHHLGDPRGLDLALLAYANEDGRMPDADMTDTIATARPVGGRPGIRQALARLRWRSGARDRARALWQATGGGR